MKKTRNTITQKVIQSRKKSFNKIKKTSLSHLQKKRKRITKERKHSVNKGRYISRSNTNKHKTTSHDFVPRIKIHKEHPHGEYKVESVSVNRSISNKPKSLFGHDLINTSWGNRRFSKSPKLKKSKKISFNLNGDIYNSNKLSNHVYNDSKPNSIKNVNRKKEKRFVPIIRKKMIPGTKR